MKKLVILESTKKVDNVSHYLKNVDKDNTYVVKATTGHFRKIKDRGEYNLGIDLKTMTPQFEIDPNKKNIVNDLISTSKTVDEIILATDPDREGEAIAWHLYEILKGAKKPFKRLKLNSITELAIKEGLASLSKLDRNYVNAGLTRQMLDRIFGFRLSPYVKDNAGGVSAGRVQSASLLLIANRQKENENFKKVDSWVLSLKHKDILFKNVKRDEKNNWVLNKLDHDDKAKSLKANLTKIFKVEDIKELKFEDKSFTPFDTPALLIASKGSLKFSTTKTTELVNSLFSKGWVTYPRTDSEQLDVTTENKLKDYIVKKYGLDRLGTLAKVVVDANAQEGHPAITPTHFESDMKVSNKCLVSKPSNNKDELTADEIKLYGLIWHNTINSMFKRPSGIKQQIYLINSNVTFEGSFKTYLDLGYIAIDETLETPKNLNVKFTKGESIQVEKIDIEKQTENGKPLLNQATLVGEMKKTGIGRPATYDKLVDLNVKRGYVKIMEGKAESLKLTPTGLKVNDYLQKDFGKIINLDYTKQMENDLDLIAKGKMSDYQNYLKNIYANLDKSIARLNIENAPNIPKCPKCHKGNWIEKTSPKGVRYISCSDYQNCKNVEFLERDYSDNKSCPECKIGFQVPRVWDNKKENKKVKYKNCSRWKEGCKWSKWPKKK